MSTHTTYFCDNCNQDRDISHGEDDGHAVNYGEMPTYDGWAEFGEPYTDSLGYERTGELHICQRCLADPEFEPPRGAKVNDWDTDSAKNLAAGREHAATFAHALETLGTRNERWGYRTGVRQVFNHGGSFAYGYNPGPKLEDGRFRTTDKIREVAT